jgi:hypothetical protein
VHYYHQICWLSGQRNGTRASRRISPLANFDTCHQRFPVPKKTDYLGTLRLEPSDLTSRPPCLQPSGLQYPPDPATCMPPHLPPVTPTLVHELSPRTAQSRGNPELIAAVFAKVATRHAVVPGSYSVLLQAAGQFACTNIISVPSTSGSLDRAITGFTG